jgi:hypothetical protein
MLGATNWNKEMKDASSARCTHAGGVVRYSQHHKKRKRHYESGELGVVLPTRVFVRGAEEGVAE